MFGSLTKKNNVWGCCSCLSFSRRSFLVIYLFFTSGVKTAEFRYCEEHDSCVWIAVCCVCPPDSCWVVSHRRSRVHQTHNTDEGSLSESVRFRPWIFLSERSDCAGSDARCWSYGVGLRGQHKTMSTCQWWFSLTKHLKLHVVSLIDINMCGDIIIIKQLVYSEIKPRFIPRFKIVLVVVRLIFSFGL